MLPRNDQRPVFSVSELAGAVRFTLEERFPLVWVEGELSNLRAPASGHWYFTLKDDDAQIRCAMFVNRNRFVRFKPRDGMQVVLRGRVSLYEARGDFQLIADHLDPAGEGALRAAFDALRRTLAERGLFAAERKRPLPLYPTHVAVVTSRTGAALRDIVAVFRRRCPMLRVTVFDVAVQGREAERQILAAFERLRRWPAPLGAAPDVALLARGGGSLEDLWAFNLESVAHAIAACPIPVVSAVGHETDFTIGDLVADLRAPTPSAGAELIAPDVADWQRRAGRLLRSLHAHWRHAITGRRQRVHWVARRLTHPGRALQLRMQRLDDLERQMTAATSMRIARASHRTALLAARFRQLHPERHVAEQRNALLRLRASLGRALHVRIEQARVSAASASRALNAVSPLDTLTRGYAIVATPAPSGERWGTPITSVAAAHAGQRVVAHLRDGTLQCRVERVDVDAN